MFALAFLALQVDSVTLLPGGTIDRVDVADVDGDGRHDLVAQTGRRLHLFGRRLDGTMGELDALLLDDRAYTWTLAKLKGDRGSAVVTMTSEGLDAHRRTEKGWTAATEALLVHPTALAGRPAIRSAPARLDVMPDLDGDGLSDAILFTAESTMIFRQTEKGFALIQKMRWPLQSTAAIGWWPEPVVEETLRIPTFYATDFTGDGRADLGVYADGEFRTYAQDGKGGFPSDPSSTARLVRAGRKKARLELEPPPQATDVDGDKAADLVLLYSGDGGVEVFPMRDGAPNTDDFVSRTLEDSYSLSAVVADVGGGRRTLITRTIEKFGVQEALDFLAEKKAELVVTFFPIEADGKPGAMGTTQIFITLPFLVSIKQRAASLERLFEPIVADLDGDGRGDYAYLNDERKLVMHRGTAKGSVEEEPADVATVAMPDDVVFVRLGACRLNGDKRDDVFAACRRSSGKDALILLMSK